MIEVRRQPAVACVAVVAGIAARDVILRLAESHVIVVAAGAVALHLLMIDT